MTIFDGGVAVGKRIYVQWTETHECTYEFDLYGARDFLEEQGVDVPEDATLEDMLELFDGADLDDAVGCLDVDEERGRSVGRTVAVPVLR